MVYSLTEVQFYSMHIQWQIKCRFFKLQQNLIHKAGDVLLGIREVQYIVPCIQYNTERVTKYESLFTDWTAVFKNEADSVILNYSSCSLQAGRLAEGPANTGWVVY